MSRQSTITGFLTGSKRKQTVGPFEQETQKKNTKIQKCSEVLRQSTRTLTFWTVNSKYNFAVPDVNLHEIHY